MLGRADTLRMDVSDSLGKILQAIVQVQMGSEKWRQDGSDNMPHLRLLP
jgi:hypothetical protein